MTAELGHAAHSKRAQGMGILDKVDRPLKIVFLGAGSFFLNSLLPDILSIPGADTGELALVDIDTDRLELAAKVSEKIIAKMGKAWTITATPDRRTVLAGAHYIVNCIEVSGTDCVAWDNDIPAKYGIDQCIGDTIGPGGIFKALRTVPVFLEVLKDIEKLCPDAYMLNYTNPMSILCLAATRVSPVKTIGLCHSVQGTSHQLADYLSIPYHELKWNCGGINHLAWFTELSHKGADLYPRLNQIATDKGNTYEKDPVRFDMMGHLGLFVTESSGHFSEYVPYYRKRPELIKQYCRDGYLGESRFYATNWPTWRTNSDERRRKQIAGAEDIPTERTWEYASYIIQAIETNAPCTIYGTVPNNALIENLPADGMVEVACLCDRNGITPTRFDNLPPQCAALCDWHMRMYDLAATACIEKSKQAAIHALMLDPLTAAVSSPAEIKQMTEEMFETQKQYLPGF